MADWVDDAALHTLPLHHRGADDSDCAGFHLALDITRFFWPLINYAVPLLYSTLGPQIFPINLRSRVVTHQNDSFLYSSQPCSRLSHTRQDSIGTFSFDSGLLVNDASRPVMSISSLHAANSTSILYLASQVLWIPTSG